MSKLSIKYKKGTDAADIETLEAKYGLTRESHIPALRIYGYANGAEKRRAIDKEPIVEYAEKQQDMGIAD